jgi:hypothetical protein
VRHLPSLNAPAGTAPLQPALFLLTGNQEGTRPVLLKNNKTNSSLRNIYKHFSLVSRKGYEEKEILSKTLYMLIEN